MYRDREKARAAQKRYRTRKHTEKYGPDARDQRGRHEKHRRGPNSPRWSDAAKILSDQGYVKIRVGRDHPLADPNGYAYEHHVVWCSAGNPRPGPGELLHHQNEVKTDNRLENLKLTTRAEHSKHHHARLADVQVRAIRESYAAGEADMPTLAERFGVPAQRISRWIRGETRRAAGGPIIGGDKRRVGKRAAGRLLDGRTRDDMPEVRA